MYEISERTSDIETFYLDSGASLRTDSIKCVPRLDSRLMRLCESVVALAGVASLDELEELDTIPVGVEEFKLSVAPGFVLDRLRDLDLAGLYEHVIVLVEFVGPERDHDLGHVQLARGLLIQVDVRLALFADGDGGPALVSQVGRNCLMGITVTRDVFV